MEHAALSLANHGKARCGDAWGYRFYTDDNLAVGIVSDGVSGASKDYLASRLTVDTFFTMFESECSVETGERLVKAVSAADRKVKESYETGGHRMLATCVAVAWDRSAGTIHWLSCGDSRLYTLNADRLTQVSLDQSRPVIARGRDGKPLVSSGALVTRNGLTVAIGALDGPPEVHHLNDTAVTALLLTTDGYHGCPSFTGNKVAAMCGCLALGKRFLMHESIVREEQQDDATVLAIRNKRVASDEAARMRLAVAEGNGFEKEGIGIFAACSTLRDMIATAIERKNFDDALAFLEYAHTYRLDLGKTALVALADQTAPDGTAGRNLFGKLIDTIRTCTNP